MAVASVQTQTKTSAGLGTSASGYLNSITIAPATPVAIGNFLFLSINTNGAGSVVNTVTDTANNAWSLWFQVNNGTDNQRTEVWTATAITASAPTITITNAASVSWAVLLREFSGVDSPTSRGAYGTSADSGYIKAHSASTSTTTVTGDYLVGGVNSSKSPETYTPGSGFGDFAAATASGAPYVSAAIQGLTLTSGGIQTSQFGSADYDKAVNFVAALKPYVNTPPSPPTNVQGTPGTASATITWSAPAGATSYTVKRSTTNGSGYVNVGSPSTTTFTNTGLTNGTTYYYVVSATNSNGTSANSAQTAVTPVVTDAPTWYGFGAPPAGKTLTQVITVFKARYQAWKDYCLTQSGMKPGMPAGAWRIQVPDQGSAGAAVVGTTFSEGIGYAAFIFAICSRVGSPVYDPNAKAYFDGIWKYYNFYKNDKGLMNWRIDPSGNVTGQNGATDGDLDMALGLVLMSRLNSNAGAINYAAEATTLINAIDKWEYLPSNHAQYPNVMTNGDGWGFETDVYMPDYHSPAHYTEFGYHTNNTTRWNDIKTVNHARSVTYFYNKFLTGYVPDASFRNGTGPVSSYPYKYGYNSIRMPWRNTLNFLWNNDSVSGAMVKKLATAERNRAGQIPANARAEGALDASSFGTYINAAFLSGFGVAGVSDTTSAQWASDVIDWLGTHNEQNYFGMCLEVIALLIMTGEFKPYRNYTGPGGGGDVGTPDPLPVTASMKYWNGTAWVSVNGLTITTAQSGTPAPTTPTPATPAYLGTLIQKEDFSSPSTYSMNHLSILDGGRMTRSAGAWMASDVDVANGALRLRVKTNPTATTAFYYDSAVAGGKVYKRKEGGYVGFYGVASNAVRKGGVWRWRQRVPGASYGFGFVPLLWPETEVWPRDGEIDTFELFSGSTTKQGGETYIHQALPSSPTVDRALRLPLDGSQSYNTDFTQWHNLACAWNPGSNNAGAGAFIKLYIDDVQVSSITAGQILPNGQDAVTYIPHGDNQPRMNLRFQTEAYGVSDDASIVGPLYWEVSEMSVWTLP